MLFYVFSFLIILAALGVVLSKNPVHSVLWLIFACLNSAGLFVLLGAEFLAMMMVIVYVGAVSVLFLFVIMMLDIDVQNSQAISSKWVILIGGLICLASFAALVRLFFAYFAYEKVVIEQLEYSNTAMIADVLYTDFIIPFQVGGAALLVAIIGAILLTQQDRKSTKAQSVDMQLARNKQDCITMLNIEPGSAVKGINYDV